MYPANSGPPFVCYIHSHLQHTCPISSVVSTFHLVRQSPGIHPCLPAGPLGATKGVDSDLKPGRGWGSTLRVVTELFIVGLPYVNTTWTINTWFPNSPYIKVNEYILPYFFPLFTSFQKQPQTLPCCYHQETFIIHRHHNLCHQKFYPSTFLCFCLSPFTFPPCICTFSSISFPILLFLQLSPRNFWKNSSFYSFFILFVNPRVI